MGRRVAFINNTWEHPRERSKISRCAGNHVLLPAWVRWTGKTWSLESKSFRRRFIWRLEKKKGGEGEETWRIRSSYLKADWTIGRRWFSLTWGWCVPSASNGLGWMTVLARRINLACVNAALRVGRSDERDTLAHAFGFRCNKGGEKPPTTMSHTTYTQPLSRSLSRAAR